MGDRVQNRNTHTSVTKSDAPAQGCRGTAEAPKTNHLKLKKVTFIVARQVWTSRTPLGAASTKLRQSSTSQWEKAPDSVAVFFLPGRQFAAAFGAGVGTAGMKRASRRRSKRRRYISGKDLPLFRIVADHGNSGQ